MVAIQKPSLDTLISRARNDSMITAAEVKQIVQRAGSSVSNKEAKAIGSLFESMQPNPFVTLPGTPERPAAAPGATQAFNAFFVARNLPFGDRADAMRAQIDDMLSRVRLDQGTTTRPRINHLPTLDMQPGLMDAPSLQAHVDVRKGEFFLSRGGGGLLPPGMEPPATRYWGPFSLPKATPTTVTEARKEKLQRALDGHKATASWSIQSDLMNVRTVEVKLKSDDKYNYTALIPVGMTNPSPALDPNTVNDFVVMRMPKVIPPNARIAPEYAQLRVDGRDV